MSSDATAGPSVPEALAAPNGSGPPEGASDSRRSLGSPFWRLFTANAISSLGDGLVLVGFPLLAVTQTSKPVLIAGVAIAGRLPALLCSVPAGVVVDRVDRRRLAVL